MDRPISAARWSTAACVCACGMDKEREREKGSWSGRSLAALIEERARYGGVCCISAKKFSRARIPVYNAAVWRTSFT